MLPDPPPRDPPENPPPPPRALANETVGTPMSAQTMQEAISFLVITGGCPFGCGRGGNCLHHPSRYGRKKPKIRRSEHSEHVVYLRTLAGSAIKPQLTRRLLTDRRARKGSGMSYTSLNI